MELIREAARGVLGDQTVAESPGVPMYQGAPVDLDGSLAGVTPARIEWTADRGNWMWDGVLIVARLMGIDPEKPL